MQSTLSSQMEFEITTEHLSSYLTDVFQVSKSLLFQGTTSLWREVGRNWRE